MMVRTLKLIHSANLLKYVFLHLDMEHYVHQLAHVRSSDMGELTVAGSEAAQNDVAIESVFGGIRMVPPDFGLHLFHELDGGGAPIGSSGLQHGRDRFHKSQTSSMQFAAHQVLVYDDVLDHFEAIHAGETRREAEQRSCGYGCTFAGHNGSCHYR